MNALEFFLSTILRPTFYRYDFFLVSQSVRQGTVSPTHYNVIWDTWDLGPEKMQRLSYKMTHLYYNWPVSLERTFQSCQSYVEDSREVIVDRMLIVDKYRRKND